jgi:hypothetical protein
VLKSKPYRNPGPPKKGICVRPAPSLCKTLTAGNAGLINGGQQRQVKRNKRETIQIRTWNILTMQKLGRLQETAEQILNTSLQIVAMQELDVGAMDIQRKKDYSIYYSCNLKKAGQFGT